MSKIVSLIVLFCIGSLAARAQQVMRIPDVQAMTGSHTHLYVLSSSDGLAVFRATGDSLLWLYNSDALLRRGSKMRSDARFAYIFGSDTRITVIDPTVSQALYAAAVLDAEPYGLARVGSRLYLAMGESGLASISLSDPAGMESTFEPVAAKWGPSEKTIDIVAHANKFYVLGSTGTIYPFVVTGGKVSQEPPITTGFDASKIFMSNGAMLIANPYGMLKYWKRVGFPEDLATVGSSIADAHLSGGGWIVRTDDARIWRVDTTSARSVTILRENANAGNFITRNKGNVWISEFGRVGRLENTSSPETMDADQAYTSRVRIAPVGNRSIPFPQPLLVSFSLEEGFDRGISWYVKLGSDALPVRGNALFWQPNNANIGLNRFTVIATNPVGAADSLTFDVEVRQFNSPPRLTPTRPVSIPAEEEYRLQLVGVDPDGGDLIRFTGINLPEGVRLDPQSGILAWTPSDRQLGRHVLQIVTSDQFGASLSNEVILNVIRVRR